MEEKQKAQAAEARAEGAQAEAFKPESVIKTLLLSKKKAKALGYPKGWLVLLDIKEWVTSILFALVAVLIIKTFLAWPITVEGSSMDPTLQDGNKLFVTSYDVRFSSAPQRGDVVICHYPGRTNKWLGILTVKTDFVKRVMGVPGDTVKREKGITYINGFALNPSRFTGSAHYTYVKNEDGSLTYYKNGQEIRLTDEQTFNYEFDYEYTLGENEYFVVGDNRYNSHDSRTWNGPDLPVNIVNDVSGHVGPLDKSMITGHVRSVFWPVGEARKVENDPDYLHPRDQK